MHHSGVARPMRVRSVCRLVLCPPFSWLRASCDSLVTSLDTTLPSLRMFRWRYQRTAKVRSTNQCTKCKYSYRHGRTWLGCKRANIHKHTSRQAGLVGCQSLVVERGRRELPLGEKGKKAEVKRKRKIGSKEGHAKQAFSSFLSPSFFVPPSP
jgi:hypothetical protein